MLQRGDLSWTGGGPNEGDTTMKYKKRCNGGAKKIYSRGELTQLGSKKMQIRTRIIYYNRHKLQQKWISSIRLHTRSSFFSCTLFALLWARDVIFDTQTDG
jgi:hypothetical protein